jgi:hypothetical protein
LWVRLGAYPREEKLKCASLGQVLTLFANIKLSSKGLSGRNALAYFGMDLGSSKLESVAIKNSEVVMVWPSCCESSIHFFFAIDKGCGITSLKRF